MWNSGSLTRLFTRKRCSELCHSESSGRAGASRWALISEAPEGQRVTEGGLEIPRTRAVRSAVDSSDCLFLSYVVDHGQPMREQLVQWGGGCT